MRARALKWLLGFAILLFPFSLFFFAFSGLPAQWQFLSAFIIGLHGWVLFVWMLGKQPLGVALRNLCWVLVLAFGVEAFGAATGFPFGEYRYTSVLGISCMGVPLAIPFAWYSSTASALGVARQILPPGVDWRLSSGWAAFLVMALDLVLEPTAGFVHHFWVWDLGRIPLLNYASWFVLALLLALLLQRPRFEMGAPLDFTPSLIYAFQWSLFAITDVVHGYSSHVFLSALLIASLVIGTKVVVKKAMI